MSSLRPDAVGSPEQNKMLTQSEAGRVFRL
jgi:hypothetical protein